MSLHIDSQLIYNNDLDWTDKILISWIECFALATVLDKPRYLATQLNLPIHKVKSSLGKLKNLGHLSTTLREGDRFVFSKRVYADN